jgi:putative peptidoglycan lipid II flippase
VTPMLVSVASIGLNLAGAMALTRWAGMGHAGLALSTSLVALAEAAALFAALARRAGGMQGARLAGAAARIVAASAVMGLVCRASSFAVEHALGSGRIAHLANVAVSVPLGALVFAVAGRLLGVAEVEAFRTACYTFFSNAPRPEAGDPPPGDR